MRAEVFRDKINRNDWRVEQITEDGGVEIAIFSGPEAQRRATAYAQREYQDNWKFVG